MKEIFDAVIKDDDKISINSDIKSLDKNFFEKNIKNKQCETIEIDGNKYWILKKDNFYILDKFDCINKKIESYEKEAVLDGLTGTYNKKSIVEFLNKYIHNFLRYKKESFSLLMIDIDFFKKINDTYGHLAGDKCLEIMSNIIKSIIRESDIFGRFGGEEFLIILPNTKMSGALKLAKRIKDAVEKQVFTFESQDIKFTISIGATSMGLTDTYESLLSRVDEALYEAKNKGRNRIEYR